MQINNCRTKVIKLCRYFKFIVPLLILFCSVGCLVSRFESVAVKNDLDSLRVCDVECGDWGEMYISSIEKAIIYVKLNKIIQNNQIIAHKSFHKLINSKGLFYFLPNILQKLKNQHINYQI